MACVTNSEVTDVKSIYCPQCDKRVEAEVTSSVQVLNVKKTSVRAVQEEAACPLCGLKIADEEMTKGNLERALGAYRDAESLLSPSQIKEAYTRYGLTQGSFAKLLGLGAATISRYENGFVQTRQIDQAIRAAADPSGMLKLLDRAHGTIPSEQEEHARLAALSMLGERAKEASARFEVSENGNACVVIRKDSPSETNGFRTLDWTRLANMAAYFAEHCKNLGRTRLNKALFYADFGCFAVTARSMSGLVYARADYGPVVDGYNVVFGALVDQGVLRQEVGEYDMQVFKSAREFDPSLFTKQELAILSNVVQFVNSFSKVSDLSAYSHREKVWEDSPSGKQLSYLYAVKLNDVDRIAGC